MLAARQNVNHDYVFALITLQFNFSKRKNKKAIVVIDCLELAILYYVHKPQKI